MSNEDPLDFSDLEDWDRVDEIIKSRLLPRLDQDVWKEEFDGQDNQLRSATKHLVRAYRGEGKGLIRTFVLITLFVGAIDILVFMPAQIYGLVFDIWGTWVILAYGGLRGRYEIASVSGTSVGFSTAEIRQLARDTAVTNIGLFWLTFGFILQIIAIGVFSNKNLIGIDSLSYLL